MGFLADKKILITGILSNRSIAYGVAHACHREGATLAFTYVNDELKERVVKIAAEFGTVPVLPCDVTKDDDVDALFDALGARVGRRSTACCTRSRSRRARRWPAISSKACRAPRSPPRTTSAPTASPRSPRARGR